MPVPIQETPTQELLEELLPIDPTHRQLEIYREISKRCTQMTNDLALLIIAYKTIILEAQNRLKILEEKIKKA